MKAAAPLQIGLFGFGVVGSAVASMLAANADQLARSAGGPLVLKRAVVRDVSRPRPVAVPAGLLTSDPRAVLEDPGIGIVVEAMGGLEPARTYVLAALGRGKAVVTANKELVAEHSQELLGAAAAAGVDLFFEASVGGGIPILRPLRETLAAAGRIRRVMGIVNGTTNYILTRMARAGLSLEAALAEAQAAGYAEADPTADVAGHDPARKIAILASLAFHTHVKSGQVPTVGITGVAPADVAYGRSRGWTLKLLARAERRGDGIAAQVHPAFLPDSHPLAGVHDAFNAIYVHGEELGEAMFYGQGAGGLPTASAVVGDVVTAAQYRRLGVSVSRPWAHAPVRVVDAGAAAVPCYLRLTGPAAGVARLPAAGVAVRRWAPLPGDALAVETGPVPPGALREAAARCGLTLENVIHIEL